MGPTLLLYTKQLRSFKGPTQTGAEGRSVHRTDADWMIIGLQTIPEYMIHSVIYQQSATSANNSLSHTRKRGFLVIRMRSRGTRRGILLLANLTN
jgi:hypothetical protein